MAKRDAIVDAYADALQAEHEKAVMHAFANESEPIATVEELEARVAIMKKAVASGTLVNEAAAHLGEVVMAFFTVGADEVENPQACFDFGAEPAQASGEGEEPEAEEEEPEEPETEEEEPEAEEEEEEPEAEEEEPEAPPARGRGRGRGRGRTAAADKADDKADDDKASSGRGRGRGGRRGPLSVVND